MNFKGNNQEDINETSGIIKSGNISKERLEEVRPSKNYKVPEINTVPAKCPGCEAKHLVPESERRKGLKFVPIYCSDCKYKRHISDVDPCKTYRR